MAGAPKPISNILAELLARRGYARVQAAGLSQQAWSEAAGETLAAQTRPGKVSRGVLEVFVTNSMLAQELGFAKKKLLARLQQLQPDEKIRDLRFRVGPLD